MKLTWAYGSGPATTQELANIVEAEGRLITRAYISSEGRCLWGIIRDSIQGNSARRSLNLRDSALLRSFRLSTVDNDYFIGTPEQRCVEMVKRLRAIK